MLFGNANCPPPVRLSWPGCVDDNLLMMGFHKNRRLPRRVTPGLQLLDFIFSFHNAVVALQGFTRPLKVPLSGATRPGQSRQDLPRDPSQSEMPSLGDDHPIQSPRGQETQALPAFTDPATSSPIADLLFSKKHAGRGERHMQ